MTLEGRHSTPMWELAKVQGVAAPRAVRGMHAQWLIEDLTKAQFAYDTATLRFDATDQAAARDFLEALIEEETPYGRYRLDRDIWHIVGSITDNLYSAGECVAEVYMGTAAAKSDEPAPHPRLTLLPSWSLRRRRGRTWQRTADSGWKDISRATLVTMRLPKAETRAIKAAREHLVIVDRHHGVRTSFLERRVTAYDMSVHERTVNELSARATSGVGWDGRNLFVDRASNSYRIYRELRFRRLWLTILDTVLAGLSEACVLSSDPAAPTGVHIDGIPTLADIDESIQAVLAGSEPLDEIRYRILMPRYGPK